MPAQSKPKTLTRLLDLLQAIPRRSSVSAQDLHTRLTERGHAVTIRSVQRDLQMLREGVERHADAARQPRPVPPLRGDYRQ